MTFDIAIIGGGPSGLTAGLYAAWSKMKSVLIEKDLPGGQVLLTERIENYPGFPEGINGPELAGRIEAQAKRFGLEILSADVERLEKNGDFYTVHLKNGNKIDAFSVIISTGATIKKLGIPGEEKFIGRGVSYCATCDGPFFKNKDVAVIGGGNAAIEEALFLTRFVKKLHLVHRKSMLRAAQSLQDALKNTGKTIFHMESLAIEIVGNNIVEGLKVKNIVTTKEDKIDCQGVFIFVGVEPNTEIFRNFIDLDKSGYILTSEDMSTSKPGVFACGDVRVKTLRQVVTAVSDGAVAAFSAQHYVEKIKGIVYK